MPRPERESGVSINLSGSAVILANPGLAYMVIVIFGFDSPVAGKSLAAMRANSSRKNKGVKQMLDFNDELRSRRIVTLVFAFLSGITAVSTAIVPAIVYI